MSQVDTQKREAVEIVADQVYWALTNDAPEPPKAHPSPDDFIVACRAYSAKARGITAYIDSTGVSRARLDMGGLHVILTQLDDLIEYVEDVADAMVDHFDGYEAFTDDILWKVYAIKLTEIRYP